MPGEPTRRNCWGRGKEKERKAVEAQSISTRASTLSARKIANSRKVAWRLKSRRVGGRRGKGKKKGKEALVVGRAGLDLPKMQHSFSIRVVRGADSERKKEKEKKCCCLCSSAPFANRGNCGFGCSSSQTQEKRGGGEGGGGGEKKNKYVFSPLSYSELLNFSTARKSTIADFTRRGGRRGGGEGEEKSQS